MSTHFVHSSNARLSLLASSWAGLIRDSRNRMYRHAAVTRLVKWKWNDRMLIYLFIIITYSTVCTSTIYFLQKPMIRKRSWTKKALVISWSLAPLRICSVVVNRLSEKIKLLSVSLKLTHASLSRNARNDLSSLAAFKWLTSASLLNTSKCTGLMSHPVMVRFVGCVRAHLITQYTQVQVLIL